MMIITLILVTLAALGFLLLFLRTAGRSIGRVDEAKLGQHLRPVDLEAFRNLVDPVEEEFLRSNLRAREFRIIQRARLRAAVDYIGGVSYNAAVLLQWGQSARRSPDPQVAEAGQRLVDEAARLRLFSVIAVGKLYLKVAFPATPLEPASIVNGYRSVSDRAALLGRLRDPARPILASRAF
jgi:hypothetical protein